jgi:hypothetical protein
MEKILAIYKVIKNFKYGSKESLSNNVRIVNVTLNNMAVFFVKQLIVVTVDRVSVGNVEKLNHLEVDTINQKIHLAVEIVGLLIQLIIGKEFLGFTLSAFSFL